MPVSVPGSHTASLTSLVFKPESLISPDSRSSKCQAEVRDSSSNEYCEWENKATLPDGLGVGAPRLGAEMSCLGQVSQCSDSVVEVEPY